jgi:hypothetical protein
MQGETSTGSPCIRSTLPTEASALKATHALRIDANQRTPQAEGAPETISQLIDH